jgi:2-oxo-4-hydroxy-4-carboxy-5-ureidoimidazoline decarboxylase
MGRARLSLEIFNFLSESEARELLLQCCHSRRWADQVIERRPFSSWEEILVYGERAWHSLAEGDWLEAFEAHPQIGDVTTLKEKFQATKKMASHEQSGVEAADEATLRELVRLNKAYKEKNGFIFIVFATGKSARQMRDILDARMLNTREAELQNAAREQWKITQLRLEKLL